MGACIGKNNARIRAIVGEFGDLEKIDIIPYSEVPEEFIASALAPAKVLSVTILDSEEKTCTVVVPNDQLSLAIGNRGQNVKLAVKLTGYKKIDIKPEFSIEPEKTEEAPAAPAEPLDAETEASLMEESDLDMTEEPAAETPATEANGIEE